MTNKQAIIKAEGPPSCGKSTIISLIKGAFYGKPYISIEDIDSHSILITLKSGEEKND